MRLYQGIVQFTHLGSTQLTFRVRSISLSFWNMDDVSPCTAAILIFEIYFFHLDGEKIKLKANIYSLSLLPILSLSLSLFIPCNISIFYPQLYSPVYSESVRLVCMSFASKPFHTNFIRQLDTISCDFVALSKNNYLKAKDGCETRG